MEKLLPVSSPAMSLAVIMTYGWVLSLHEKRSHPQPRSGNHNPWNKINQHTLIATVAFAIVKGVFKICFQVHFPTSHLQSFVSQASGTNHSPPPRDDAAGLFYAEPSSLCGWVSVTHHASNALRSQRSLSCLFNIPWSDRNYSFVLELSSWYSSWWGDKYQVWIVFLFFFFLTKRGD